MCMHYVLYGTRKSDPTGVKSAVKLTDSVVYAYYYCYELKKKMGVPQSAAAISLLFLFCSNQIIPQVYGECWGPSLSPQICPVVRPVSYRVHGQ